MKKLTTLFYFSLLVSGSIMAQNNFERCGTTEEYVKKLNSDPEFKAMREASDNEAMEIDRLLYENNYKKSLPTKNEKANKIMDAQGVVYTIPVVFHILHLGGGENISEAQIMSCIDQLNADFAGLNSDTIDTQLPFRGLEADAQIRFAMATKDPNGNCTNGITRHYDANTDWVKGTTPFQYTWNTSKYYNIYVTRTLVNENGDALGGYSSFPGMNSIASNRDVTVMVHSSTGNMGTSNLTNSHTMAHETGHFLNLYHIWDCCTAVETACGTDNVSDTPQTMGYAYRCPSGTDNQICNPGISENPNNHMDYSYCGTMFTAGQATRMRNVLINNTGNVGRANLVSSTNLTNTGVTNPQVCIPAADFTTNRELICAGNTITFNDYSANATPTSWAWDFPGGTPSTSTDSIPTILYETPGVYSVTYTATSSAGSNAITKTNYISVMQGTADVQAPLVEGFEFISFPNTEWTTENPGGGITWVQDNTVGATGTNCIKLNNFTNSSNQEEVFYTPSYNIAAINAANPGASLTFKLAYQRKTTAAAEKLQVYSSTSCGQTWNLRYSKSGATLATITAANTSAFVPTSATDWRTETVSISALMAQTNVWFKFVFTSDAGTAKNNIYIDNINLSNSVVGLEDIQDGALQFDVYPNPNNGEMNASFSLTDKRTVKLELIDLLGKTIETTVDSKLNAGDYTFKIGNENHLNPGIYINKLTIDGKTYIKKIIIE